ncbi:DUF222 domain-containing protein [Egicoccus sp. AB-alg6-2]|uniref:HNH endonuclease signature motif containing protein n=1 Tax=Egicoccus sp. AB-alg6-2 TaxID=3242692 RepID=UPI00359EB681
MPLEQWLLIVARRTGTDRRMLMTTADVCRRLPALLEAFVQGRVSWSQVRTLVLQVHRLPHADDEQLDTALAELIHRAEGGDADQLGQLARFIDHDFGDRGVSDNDREASEPAEFLALQPRLDGTGGRFFGEAGPASFAILENATNPGPPEVATGRRFGQHADRDTTRQLAESAGRRRLTRLIDLLDHTCDPGGGSEADGDNRRSRPTLLVVADLDTLCDRDQTPARLLHHLAGGRMYLTSTAARRLVDQRGAELRTTILDDTGAVVGIGRKHRDPPGWLAEGLLALHDTCTEPGCTTASRSCQIDHAIAWHPARPGDLLGRTDADNLAPLCTSANRTKEADGWTCTQTADGTRRWRHPRTGLTTTTIPAGTRPPWLPAARPPDRHEPRAGPDRHQPRAGPLDDRPRGSRSRPPPLDRPPDHADDPAAPLPF